MRRILFGFFRTYQRSRSRAVMAVGYVQGRHFTEQLRDAGDIGSLVDDPEGMSEAIVLRYEVIFGSAGGVLGDNPVQLGIIGISKEYRFDVGIVYPDMLHAVFFLVTAGQLMFLDNAIHIVGHVSTDN